VVKAIKGSVTKRNQKRRALQTGSGWIRDCVSLITGTFDAIRLAALGFRAGVSLTCFPGEISTLWFLTDSAIIHWIE